MPANSSYELAARDPPSRRPSSDSANRPHSRGELIRSTTISENLKQFLRHRAGHDPDAASALDDYQHLSLKKAHPRFTDLVWFSTSSVASLLDVSPPITYSRCFSLLHTALLEHAEAPFQLCAVAESCVNPRKPFSFTRSLVALVQGRYDDLDNAIQTLVVWMLCLDWHIGDDGRSKLLTALRPDPSESLVWDYHLPSETHKEPEHDIFSPDGDTVVFKWARIAPRFSGDLNVHIWQPQNDLPSLQRLTLVILPRDLADSDSHMRVFVVAKSPLTVRYLRDSFVDSLKDKIHPASRLDTVSSAMVFIVSLLQFIRADLKQFMTGSRQQIHALRLQGRRSPSAAKIQYIRHLEDFQVTVARCCADLAHTTELLAKCYSEQSSRDGPGDTIAESAAQTLKELDKDFQFLSREIQNHCVAISPVKKMIDEQLDLRSRTRTLVVQILVALYVPLSFITSFLGMNIDNTDDTTQTNYTAAYIRPRSQQDSSSNSDGAQFFNGLNVNSTTSNNQPQTWPLKMFFIAGVPLTVATILAPLVAGAIFRAVFRSVHKYYPWWRLLVICLYPPLVYILSCLENVLGGGALSVVIGLSWALVYAPFLAFCVWRLVQCRKDARQLRLERKFRIWRWLHFFGWLVFLAMSFGVSSTGSWIGVFARRQDEGGIGVESDEDLVKYIDDDTGWFRKGKGVEGMDWALKHPDWYAMGPWIAVAGFYLLQGAFRWCRENWRRRAEKASRNDRDV